jgi:hypothetical protein
MKTNQTIIIVLVSILLIATLTNPSRTEHEEKIKEAFTTYYPIARIYNPRPQS